MMMTPKESVLLPTDKNIMRMILNEGMVTKYTLEKKTDHSRATILRRVKELETRGFIKVVSRSEYKRTMKEKCEYSPTVKGFLFYCANAPNEIERLRLRRILRILSIPSHRMDFLIPALKVWVKYVQELEFHYSFRAEPNDARDELLHNLNQAVFYAWVKHQAYQYRRGVSESPLGWENLFKSLFPDIVAQTFSSYANLTNEEAKDLLRYLNRGNFLSDSTFMLSMSQAIWRMKYGGRRSMWVWCSMPLAKNYVLMGMQISRKKLLQCMRESTGHSVIKGKIDIINQVKFMSYLSTDDHGNPKMESYDGVNRSTI